MEGSKQQRSNQDRRKSKRIALATKAPITFSGLNRRVGERRNLEQEERGGKHKAKSGAMSSYEALFYHDIPTVVLERLAKRYTGGHKKYGVEHINVNYMVGLDDPAYICDRYNHAMQHLLDLKKNKNQFDDDAGGALWNIAFLIVAEHECPEAFQAAFVQDKLFGKAAKELQAKMRKKK